MFDGIAGEDRYGVILRQLSDQERVREPSHAPPRVRRLVRRLVRVSAPAGHSSFPGDAAYLITGGAGFLGSHLCDRLLSEGHEVIGLDNFVTGNRENIAHLLGNEKFSFRKHDVSNYIFIPGKVDAVMHFASPASPIDYLKIPIQTLKVGSLGIPYFFVLAPGCRNQIAARGVTILLVQGQCETARQLRRRHPKRLGKREKSFDEMLIATAEPTPDFARGTEPLARAIADSDAFSIAGGGDTLAAIAKYGIEKDVGYISTGGGAFLEVLEGKTLPAFEILQKRAAG